VGKRAYVVGIDPETFAVKLGTKEDLLQSEIQIGELALRSGVELPLEAWVVIRYRGTPARARIERVSEQAAKISFFDPVSAPSPGQFAVFYQHDQVLGGGLITALG